MTRYFKFGEPIPDGGEMSPATGDAAIAASAPAPQNIDTPPPDNASAKEKEGWEKFLEDAEKWWSRGEETAKKIEQWEKDHPQEAKTLKKAGDDILAGLGGKGKDGKVELRNIKNADMYKVLQEMPAHHVGGTTAKLLASNPRFIRLFTTMMNRVRPADAPAPFGRLNLIRTVRMTVGRFKNDIFSSEVYAEAKRKAIAAAVASQNAKQQALQAQGKTPIPPPSSTSIFGLSNNTLLLLGVGVAGLLYMQSRK